MPNNPENILPHRIRSAEEAREKGRAGGLRSGVKRREQASLREAARLILSMDVQSPEAQRVLEKLGLDPDERTNAAALTAAMVAKAAAGDVKAYEALSRNMGALDDPRPPRGTSGPQTPPRRAWRGFPPSTRRRSCPAATPTPGATSWRTGTPSTSARAGAAL